MAIYLRFGAKVRRIISHTDNMVVVECEDGYFRERPLESLKADGGQKEIRDALDALNNKEKL